MNLKGIKEMFGKNVRVVQRDGDIIIGIFCSFERAEENKYKRENIDIETEKNVLICVYLDEIKSIELEN